MCRFYLVLLPNGDIEIRRCYQDRDEDYYDVVWHKSYNMGDDLKENLLLAYKAWEDYYGY